MGCINNRNMNNNLEIKTINYGQNQCVEVHKPSELYEYKENTDKNEIIENVNHIENTESRNYIKVKTKTQKIKRAKRFKSLRHTKTKLIGNYEILDEIIDVPYGSIHNCNHITTSLKRTIKIIKINSYEGLSINVKEIESKISPLKALDHPNILRIHYIFQSKRSLFLVMDPWEGNLLRDNLLDLMNQGEDIIANVICQILLACAYCHSKKIIHRDLNPKIIFFANIADPIIKVSEFGASSYMDPDNILACRKHSKAYIAPEIFNNVLNEKCDSWSVGIILYQLLTGEIPLLHRLYSEQEDFDLYNILKGRGISEDASNLLCKLLERDFTKRISATEALEYNWIKKIRDSQYNKIVEIKSLENLEEFQKHPEMQDAVREFMAGRVISIEENNEIANVFKALDSNCDGKISTEELFLYYNHIMNESEAKSIVEKIFMAVDRDNSGFIEFDEFMKANLKDKYLMSFTNIYKAFKLLDIDNSQKLSKTELQTLFEDTGDKKLITLIAEADINGDGEIDFKEFYTLMRQKK